MRETLTLTIRFIVLTYGIAWACWGLAWALLVLGTGGQGADAAQALARALEYLGTLAPLYVAWRLFPRLASAGAVCLSAAPSARGHATAASLDASGRTLGFWGFMFNPRVRVWGIGAIVTLTLWRYVSFHAALGFPASVSSACAAFVAGIPGLLLGGGLEEPGWRGALQPLLERLVALRWDRGTARRRATLLVPLAVGLVWGMWHLPLALMPGTYQSVVPFWMVLVAGVGLSYSLAVVRAWSDGVVWCVLCHMVYNSMLVGIPQDPGRFVAMFAVEAVIGLAVRALQVRRRVV